MRKKPAKNWEDAQSHGFVDSHCAGGRLCARLRCGLRGPFTQNTDTMCFHTALLGNLVKKRKTTA